jgi:hypothetical protein
MWKDSVRVSGICRIYDDKTGKLLREADNMVVNTGLNHLRDILSNLATVPNALSHIAVGSGSTPPVTANTTLESEITRLSAVVTEPADYQVLYTATFSAGVGTGNWYEAGILNNAVGGTLFNRLTFALLTKQSSDSFTIQYTIGFSDDGV